jgi:hypothetical protein
MKPMEVREETLNSTFFCEDLLYDTQEPDLVVEQKSHRWNIFYSCLYEVSPSYGSLLSVTFIFLCHILSVGRMR